MANELKIKETDQKINETRRDIESLGREELEMNSQITKATAEVHKAREAVQKVQEVERRAEQVVRELNIKHAKIIDEKSKTAALLTSLDTKKKGFVEDDLREQRREDERERNHRK